MPKLSVLLFLFLSPAAALLFAQTTGRGAGPGQQGSFTPTAVSCEEILQKAISLNEGFKKAVSDGGRRAFGLEAENHFHTVVVKRLSGCVTYASENSNIALSNLILELAYSYADSAHEVIPIELAKLYSRNPAGIEDILLSLEETRRSALVEMLKQGLDGLFNGKAEKAAR